MPQAGEEVGALAARRRPTSYLPAGEQAMSSHPAHLQCGVLWAAAASLAGPPKPALPHCAVVTTSAHHRRCQTLVPHLPLSAGASTCYPPQAAP
jgi:hypothetical protein